MLTVAASGKTDELTGSRFGHKLGFMGSFHAYVFMLDFVYLVVGVKPYLRPHTPDSFLCQSRLFGRFLRSQLLPGRFQFLFGLIRFFLCLLRLVRFPAVRAFLAVSTFLTFSPFITGPVRPGLFVMGFLPSVSVRFFLPPHMVGGAGPFRILPELPGGLRAMLARGGSGLRRRVLFLKTQAAGRGGIRRLVGFLLRAMLARGEGIWRRLFGLAFLWFLSDRLFLLSRNIKKPASTFLCVELAYITVKYWRRDWGIYPRGGAHGKS